MAETSAVNLFSEEYEQELRQWLHRRFRALCWTYLVLDVALLAMFVIVVWMARAGDIDQAATIIGAAVFRIGVPIWFLQRRDLREANRERLLRAASLMVLLHVLLSVGSSLADLYLTGSISPGNLLGPIFVWHLTACALLPWSPKESVRPFVIPLVIWAGLTLIAERGDPLGAALSVAVGPIVFLPGLAICAWRLRSHGRDFERRMVTFHFRSMRKELARARQIHESLFPEPYDDGYVQFDYAFEPMREMGGDYIHLHVGPTGLVHAAVLDVTGHGLDAALTVNRLYGELERIRAEQPDARPGEVLRLLNRYIHGTMARHEMYATGACLTIDPYEGEILWASGGHPPAFLRGDRTGLHELSSTAPMLGVLGDERFDPNEMSMTMSEGDVLLLYTDGVTETRSRDGRPFGFERLKDALRAQPAPRRWTSYVTARLQKHRGGRTEDDVLVASFTLRARRGGEEAMDEAASAEAIGAAPMSGGERE